MKFKQYFPKKNTEFFLIISISIKRNISIIRSKKFDSFHWPIFLKQGRSTWLNVVGLYLKENL